MPSSLYTSDYTCDNLLAHLKALRALGLWVMNWDEIAIRFGINTDASFSLIHEIDKVLIEKMVLAMGLTSEAGWKELIYLLGFGRGQTSLKQVIDAFYERKHEEGLKNGTWQKECPDDYDGEV